MSSWRKGNLRLAVHSLRLSRARSALTMLGIVIGVSAVVCVICIGQGVKQQISKQVRGFGPDVVTIRPGAPASHELFASTGLPSGATSLLTNADLEVVKTTPGVSMVVPLAVATGSAKGDHTVTSPLVIATSADLPKVIGKEVTQGGFFDSNINNHTVVLGRNISRQLFDDTVPLGQTLTYRGQRFIVTGLFDSFNSTPFSLSASFNNAIFLPYATAQALNGDSLAMYQILAKAADKNQVPQLARSIDARLVIAHGGAQQSSVLTSDSAANSSNDIIHLLTLMIVGVAAIALIVGGVGIMNVMLVSVAERLHEIGIRKAIGATNRQILMQFMTEGLVLSVVGALSGLILSLVILGLLKVYSGLQPAFVWQVFVLAPLSAVAVSVIFGAAPALKAARKDPIEALRNE